MIFLAIACYGQAEQKAQAVDQRSTKIEVIDFYGKHRCATCQAIESNAKYTLETFFNDEMKDGLVTFRTVNVDDKKNYALAEIYEVTGTALFLNVLKDGEEKHIDLTSFAFLNGRDKEKFSAELKQRVRAQLNSL